MNTALVDTEFPYLLTNFNVIEDQGATNQLLYITTKSYLQTCSSCDYRTFSPFRCARRKTR